MCVFLGNFEYGPINKTAFSIQALNQLRNKTNDKADRGQNIIFITDKVYIRDITKWASYTASRISQIYPQPVPAQGNLPIEKEEERPVWEEGEE